ncbi:MAG TPA: DNA repair protein RadC [Pseudomonadales bacterium]
MAIHHWPATEQPREKLLKAGAPALSDAELLAIFLRTGVSGCSAVDLARQLLMQYGSLTALLNADRQTFCAARGLGPVKYVQLQAVLEMARRCFWEELDTLPALSSAAQARDYLYSKLHNQPREVFACLFLNSQNCLIAYEELFHGTLNQAPVFPREIARKVLSHNAAAVILAHNHPSGVAEPSMADRNITRLIQEALQLLDVRVLDHFVIGAGNAYSFAENGLM